jgi:hypothetical protein
MCSVSKVKSRTNLQAPAIMIQELGSFPQALQVDAEILLRKRKWLIHFSLSQCTLIFIFTIPYDVKFIVDKASLSKLLNQQARK